MEPHRWLPLEANPDVSARPGQWGAAVCEGGCPPDSLPAVGLAGGWRRGEGRGLRAPPGCIASEGVVVWLEEGLIPWIRLSLNCLLFSAFFAGHESGKKILFEVVFSLCSFGPVSSRFHGVKAPSYPRRVPPSFPTRVCARLLMSDRTGTSPVKILYERKTNSKKRIVVAWLLL